MRYYMVRVQFENEVGEKGKIKKTTENYIVDSISPTEAEAKTYKWLQDQKESRSFEVIAAVESKIIQVIK